MYNTPFYCNMPMKDAWGRGREELGRRRKCSKENAIKIVTIASGVAMGRTMYVHDVLY